MFNLIRQLLSSTRKEIDLEKSKISHSLKGPLLSYLESSKSLSRKKNVADTNFIAVDFETTGLGDEDQIVSMGFCPISDGVIKLAKCEHVIIKADRQPTNESVIIHGITHDQIEKGISPEEAMKKFLTYCSGSIIVAHFHKIERQFSQTLARHTIGVNLPLFFVDTFLLAKASMQRRHQAVTPNSLRLFNLRSAYHLPFYKAHNALEDAISTAELFLAQLAATSIPIENLTLRDLGLVQYQD